MKNYQPYLDWIDTQYNEMCQLVETWSNINSGSKNLDGLATMLSTIEESFRVLGGHSETLILHPKTIINEAGKEDSLPLGKALSIKKNTGAPIRIFLGAHLDTVFPVDSPFQTCRMLDEDTLQGPGVSDIKGGIVIMFKMLQALERSPYGKKIDWEILFNPDEEIGSHGSEPLLRECAKRADIGLVFEPSLPDGTLICSRKGSGGFVLVVRGRSAHVGREFHLGRSAIVAMAPFIHEIDALNDPSRGIIANVGKVEGGGPTNIVPSLAICRFNIRVDTVETMNTIEKHLESLVEKLNKESKEGISFTLHGKFTRGPKPFNESTQSLFQAFAQCGEKLGMTLSWQSSGGVCDGNILAAEGLPTIDTLGVRGGGIHTHEEYVKLQSLTERCRLTTLFLMQLTSGEINMRFCKDR
ncbi:MAG: glutamate carboxypeptidase [Chlamydiales bacterium]|jgi:glutamate carboxypeptidase